MDNPDYLISTPENVDLHLELAGIGNRVIAAAIDSAAIGAIDAVLAGIMLGVAVAVESSGTPTEVKNSIYFWAVCILVLALFIVSFGYFVFFEGVWHGQTPGKRFAGIRVIEANGQPVSWGPVFIRNFLRLLEGMPGVFLGILPMIFDKNERRWGDMAAGTIVIRERMQSLGTSDLRIVGNNEVDTLVDTGQISPDEYHLLVAFLKRRDMMLLGQRERLAIDLCKHFRNTLSLMDDGDPPERVIEKLFIAYRRRAELQAE
jgi:uncharacterized RDD family membrane protein YckC